jgi:hypothetical protein
MITFDASAVLVLAPVMGAAAFAGGTWARRASHAAVVPGGGRPGGGRWSSAVLAFATLRGCRAAGPRRSRGGHAPGSW